MKERAKERAVSVGQILDGEVQPRYWKVKRAMVYGIDTLNLEEAVLLLKTIVDYRHIKWRVPTWNRTLSGTLAGIRTLVDTDHITLEFLPWGDGPFFTVRGFDEARGTVLLSTRYSRAIKHRVDFRRVYFTHRSSAKYVNRVNTTKEAAK